MSPLSVEQLLSITKSPGAQYLLLDGEKTLSEIFAGYAKISSRSVVIPETTFNAYSLTKTFTSAAILKLVEQGKLSLDAPVNPLLPQFAFSHQFTLRQLLSHQSGIGNPIPLKWIRLEYVHFDEAAFSNEIISKNLKLKFTPGSKMSYTNVGYLVLGKLIEQASGADYKTFVTENILKPHIKNGYASFYLTPQIHATGYHPTLSFSNLLLGYLIDKKTFMEPSAEGWTPFKLIQVTGSPYGGIIANTAGLAEYLRAFLNKTVLTEQSLTEIFTIQRDNMCLGWYKGKLGKLDYYCHAGGGGGYYCEIRLYPQINTGSVLMTNRSGFTDQRMLDKIDKHYIAWN